MTFKERAVGLGIPPRVPPPMPPLFLYSVSAPHPTLRGPGWKVPLSRKDAGGEGDGRADRWARLQEDCPPGATSAGSLRFPADTSVQPFVPTP